jgi:hypothetical protein
MDRAIESQTAPPAEPAVRGKESSSDGKVEIF